MKQKKIFRIMFTIVCFVNVPICPGRGQWERVSSPAPATSLVVQGKTLFSGYNAGGGRVIFRSGDSGNTWHPSDTGIRGAGVTALYANDSLLLAGTYIGIFRSTNGGNTWVIADSMGSYGSIDAFTGLGKYLFAGATTFTGFSVVLRSSDQGMHWTEYLLLDAAENVRGLTVAESSLFVGSLQGDMWQSTDTGNTWLQLPNGQLNVTCLYYHDGFLFAVPYYDFGAYFSVYRSSDGGNTWSYSQSGIDSTTGEVNIASYRSNLFLSVWNGVGYGQSEVYRSTNDGESWQSITDTITRDDIPSMLAADGYLFIGLDIYPWIYRYPLADFEFVAQKAPSISDSLQIIQSTENNSFEIRLLSPQNRDGSELTFCDLLGREIGSFPLGHLKAGTTYLHYSNAWYRSGIYFCKWSFGLNAKNASFTIVR